MRIRFVDGPKLSDMRVSNLPVIEDDLERWKGNFTLRCRQADNICSGHNPSGCIKYYKRVDYGTSLPTYELIEKRVSEVHNDA